MKRSAPASKAAREAKKPRPEVPEYHLAPTVRDPEGNIIWPAPAEQIQTARSFIKECAASKEQTVIVPDKDADGLSSGAILFRTLVLLGLDPDKISVHLLTKGNTVHTESEREAIQAIDPSFVFVLDQGSRKAPPVIDTPHRALVIDHHYAEAGDFPSGAQFVTACHSPPVATSSLLTYLLCEPLHHEVKERCDWLCIVGTHGDLGNTLKWEPPFPSMKDTFKRYTKKLLNDVVSLINAPRRTASYDVVSAWDALLAASEDNPPSLSKLMSNKRLLSARAEINEEVERCTHTAPKFSYDTRIAVFRISSKAQVHPVIATRWAGHLQSKNLEVVMVANEGYLDDMVNFSCRIPRCARARDPPVNIIQTLKEVAASSKTGNLTERLGESFARGHKEASGGIVPKEEFEELMAILRVGEKPAKSDTTGKENGKKEATPKNTQKNTLMNYFGTPRK